MDRWNVTGHIQPTQHRQTHEAEIRIVCEWQLVSNDFCKSGRCDARSAKSGMCDARSKKHIDKHPETSWKNILDQYKMTELRDWFPEICGTTKTAADNPMIQPSAIGPVLDDGDADATGGYWAEDDGDGTEWFLIFITLTSWYRRKSEAARPEEEKEDEKAREKEKAEEEEDLPGEGMEKADEKEGSKVPFTQWAKEDMKKIGKRQKRGWDMEWRLLGLWAKPGMVAAEQMRIYTYDILTATAWGFQNSYFYQKISYHLSKNYP